MSLEIENKNMNKKIRFWLLISIFSFVGFGFYVTEDIIENASISLVTFSNAKENFVKDLSQLAKTIVEKEVITKNSEAPNADYEIDAYNGQTVTVCSGNFYDSGGSTGNYANNENYSIAFCSDNGNAITIDFTSFIVENQASCSYDGLRIYDGSSSSATLLGTYCTNSPGTVTSSGTCLYFEFYSDNIVPDGGWAATISCAASPSSGYEIDAYNGQTVNTCSGNFYDSGGSGSNYGDSENNAVTFCSDNGNPITMDFTAFDIEYDATCTYDGLRIYDGSNTSATLIGTYCGTNSPGTVTSTGTCLHFVFYSDGSINNPGWEATINCSGGAPTTPLYATLDNINNATCANSDGDISITTTGGTTPYSYAWSNGALSEDLMNIPAGNYVVTVSDANGSQVVENYTVYNTSPVSIGYSVSNAACPTANGSINLTPFNGTAPYTFVWSNGATSEDISSLSDALYEVTVTDDVGCEAVASILVGCGAEDCSNGIDDDGDGFIDYYDSDCPCDNSGFFYGNCVPSCQYTPPSGSSGFDLTTEWTGTTGVTNISQLFVGDMDGEPDEMPEIVTMKAMNYHASDVNAIYILNGTDGSLKYHPNTLRYHNRNKGLAVGDVDSDGRPEFFYVTAADEATGNATKIACYEYNPAGVNPSGSGTGTFDLQWTSNQTVTCGLSVTDQPYTEDFTVSLADFNYDGVPEIYVGNDIFNAQTGTKIATGGANSIGSWNAGEFTTSYHVMAVSVAVDVLPDAACADCSGLELVAGNQVYSVNIGTGTMTVQRTAANSLPDGNTAIVDYDLDGDLDAVITSNDASSSFLYIWDLQTTAQIGNTHTVANTSTLFYHPINTPIIADFDGDNRPEIGVCGNLVFQVVEDHLTNISGTGGTLWSITTSDNSGQTGASVFDFNGDGTAEVVYRDESNLRVISGSTGSNLATFPCGSGTGGEYPVIADIDNDDETEIVCNCSSSPGSSNATAYTTAFKSDNFPWVATRSVWNQYAYFNVNINDDLTIPQQQQTHHTVGNPALGTTGTLNTFLKQVSPLDKSGNRLFPSPDLTTSTVVDGDLCVSNSTVALNITLSNNGQSTAPSGVPISIYETDPETTNATLLATITTNSSISDGNSITVSHTLDVSTFSFPKMIYVVVNDDNSATMPYDLSTDFPVTTIAECDFTNNKEDVNIATGCIPVEICGNGTDDDGDGLIDCEDPDCYLASNSGDIDTDGDGIGNSCDIDDDGDGILDTEECSTITYSPTTLTFVDDGLLDGNESGTITTASGAVGTWQISHHLGATASFVNGGLSTNDELFFEYTGSSGNWNLDTAIFSTNLPSSANIQYALYGYADADADISNPLLGSKFNQYTISWEGAIGNATVYDSDNQLVENNGSTLINGGNFNQRDCGTWSTNTGTECTPGNVAIRNKYLQWYIVFPTGATNFKITALGGASKEAFRFSAVEVMCQDTDGDGVEDYLDIDSDNDGITDLVESQGNSYTAPSGNDIDFDGLDDAFDNNTGDIDPTLSAGITPTNSDGTGNPNHLDIDADDDGIPDNIEGQTTASYIPPSGDDTDGDGLDDAYDSHLTSDVVLSTGISPVNTDGTDNVDYLDADSDNDGTPDIQENGDTDNVLAGTDTDNDGLDDNFDTDNVTWDVNDNINDPNPSTLGDADGDVAADGSNAVGMTADVDYRDVAVFAEVCNDGIDNDGDGYIDDFDSDCPCNNFTAGEFYNNCVTCEATLPLGNCFDIQLDFATQDASAGGGDVQNYTMSYVGDIDNDGELEIVGKSDAETEIYIFNGKTGVLEWTISDGPNNSGGHNELCIGDVDGDGNGEIYFTTFTKIRSYEFNGSGFTQKFDVSHNLPTSSPDRYRNLVPQLADFNEDGTPELFVGSKIYNVNTGAAIAYGGDANNFGRSSNTGISASNSVAIDILPDGFCSDCSGLELVAGDQIFSVNIATGTMTVAVNSAISGFQDGKTAVADIDNDGDLDVVFTKHATSSRFYAYDAQTGTNLITNGNQYSFTNGAVTGTGLNHVKMTNTGGNSISQPNIADLDNDGLVEFVFVSKNRLICLENDFTLKWYKNVSDVSSGFTTTSSFDLNGDGILEVLYGSEDSIYIINGVTGSTLENVYRSSGSSYEYPTVADVDQDGASEILISSGNSILVFESACQPWMPSRGVINQIGYFGMNVNDDLTIPQEQQSHHLQFPSSSGNRPFNGFLNQMGFYDDNGDIFYPSPDMVATLDSVGTIENTNIWCGDSIKVYLTLANTGMINMGPEVPISVYDGNPTTTAATLLKTFITGTTLLPNSGDEKISANIPLPSSSGNLYIVVNDAGVTTANLPYSFTTGGTFPNTQWSECNYEVLTVPFNCSTSDITGTVFEDINYGGGNGRTYTGANISAQSSSWSNNAIAVPNARVELYDNTGAFVTSTTTNASGQYTFSSLTNGDYSVRVVNSTVSSNRASNSTGKTIIPVQTFRATASSNITNEVGGADPAKVDANSNTTSATLASLTTASTTAQSVTTVTITGSNTTGIDFGYNYDVITNTNNSGQGSFRQFILNSNELGNTNLDQEDNPTGGVSFPKEAGWETSIFMIPSTSTHTIQPTSIFDNITDAKTHISGYTQSGSSQGTISARTLNIELEGNSSFDGLRIYTDDVQVSGLVLHTFYKGIRSFKLNSTNTFVWGNYIGTQENGTIASDNVSNGIEYEDVNNSFIGTNGDNVNDVNEGNLIAKGYGRIVLDKTNNVLIAGNYIGTDKTGNVSLNSNYIGVAVYDATGANYIGFNDALANTNGNQLRNVISGNGTDGIRITDSDDQVIAGNYIGTNATGLAALGNSQYGIHFRGAVNDAIIGTNANGDDDVSERNIISANGNGFRMESSTSGTGTTIKGNYIGTDVTGNTALGNSIHGIELNGSATATVIGTNGDGINDDVEGNVIAGNGGNGIRLGISSNTIAGNKIGVGADGTTALGNGQRGILVVSSASNNVIGFRSTMTNTDELIVGNIIKNNADVGVGIDNSGGTGNRISRNQLADNGSLGIDLNYDGVTPNDNGDGDNGANTLLNFPVISSAVLSGNNLTIKGFAPSSSTIEFFIADAGPNPNPLGSFTTSFGEGAVYLFDGIEGSGSDLDATTGTYTDDGTGASSTKTQNKFEFTFDVTSLGLTNTTRISSTARDASNNTSEFSGVTMIGIPEICNNGIDDDGDGLIDCADPDCYLVANTGGTDTDGDGYDDNCDQDDDNDGILDVDECPTPTTSGLTGPLTTFTAHITTTNASSNAVPHTLDSITYGGTVYRDFIVPDSYTPGFTLTDLTGVSFVKEGAFLFDIGSNANYNTDILPAFQSRNLNAYQDLDRNDFSNGDYFDLKYNTPVISTSGGFIAVTERGGNNPQVIQALDASGNIIGTTVNVATSDYVDVGVRVDPSGSQNANIALYPIDALAPVGTEIHGIRISFGTGGVTTTDGPDAKAFLFGNVSSFACDYDGDGIPNHQDLDSDNDGCPDALEGTSSFTSANITNNRLTGSVTTDGIPTVAGVGQGVGSSQNINTVAVECDACNAASPLFTDNDSDGIGDVCDIDDDNDGILDEVECPTQSATWAVLWSSNTGIKGGIHAPFNTDVLSNAPNLLTFGTGFTSQINATGLGNTLVHVSSGADQSTLNGARLDNDYVEMEFTTQSTLDLVSLSRFEYLLYKDQSTNATPFGDYNWVVEISTDNFTTYDELATGIYSYLGNTDPVYYSGDNGGGNDHIAYYRPLDYQLLPNTTYKVRFYFFGDDDGLIIMDDLGLSFNYAICDTDGDNIPNHLDIDSDNDGITDLVESQGNSVTVPSGNDIDNDGLDDAFDNNTNSTDPTLSAGINPVNSDGTGNPNYLDIDADDDGIPDNIEGQTTAAYIPPSGTDTDGDGLDDAYDNNNSSHDPILSLGVSPVNTDSQDNVDYLDNDSDNDGIPDIQENGDTDNTLAGTDTDNDGLDDNFDTDNVTWDVNDNINDPNPSTLGDADGDIAADGNNAVGMTSDVDYRDAFSPENCSDGVDNDGDGDIDCADSDCAPVITNVNIFDAACPIGSATGRIVVTASVPSGSLTYRINGGLWQTSSFFSSLPAGSYTLEVRRSSSNCITTYGSPIVIADATGCSEICGNGLDDDGDGAIDCEDSDCYLAVNSGDVDTDGDGIGDGCDLDDDNDGILDTEEDGTPFVCSPPVITSFDFQSLDGNSNPEATINNSGLEVGGAKMFLNIDLTGNAQVLNAGIQDNHIPNSFGVYLGQHTTAVSSSHEIVSEYTFDRLVTDVSFSLHDIDHGDYITINAYSGTTLINLTAANYSFYAGTVMSYLGSNKFYGGVNNVSSTEGSVDITLSVPIDKIVLRYYDEITTGTYTFSNLSASELCYDDFDNDGVINSLDIDSDDDGIIDLVEAQLTYTAPSGNDIDNDGLDDAYDLNTGSNDATLSAGISPVNSDVTGGDDYLDIDADDDGIPDNIEGQTTAAYIPPSGNDTDGDGLDDAYDNNNSNHDPILSIGISPVNTDSQDNVDYLDNDSDNDGIPDIQENGDTDNTLAGTDTDNDGLDDNFDTDNVTWDVNDNIDDPNPSTLGDGDGDVAANGNNAVPMTGDVDYRDGVSPEVCNDGIDNDGDGDIDIADSDCICNSGSQNPIWVVDEDTGTDNLHLWSYSDYSNANTGVDYGRLQYYDPSTSTVRDAGDANDMEALAVNTFTGMAYFFSSSRSNNGPSGSQALFRYDLNEAAANQGNIVLTLIGHITRPNNWAMEALAFDPNTNRFYTADPIDGDGNSSTSTDNLYYIDLTALNSNPLIATSATLVGAISGIGETNDYVDGLEFDDSGNLYAIDGTDDKLYQISPSTGAITAIIDNNLAGGTGHGSIDIETISWDEGTQKMIALNNGHEEFIELDITTNGNNTVLMDYSTTPGMPSSADMEGSAIFDVCTPKMSLGNLVFKDNDNNNVFTTGEGIDDVIVELYQSGVNVSTASPLAKDTTSGGGFYLFENLKEGDYFVYIPASEFANNEPLFGLTSLGTTGADNGTDDDDNGLDAVNPPSTGISSIVVTLTENVEPINGTTETGAGNTIDDALDFNGDMTLDFGFSIGTEICTDGFDNDGDGLIDCADSDCKPSIISVVAIQPTCTNKTGGQITITATGTGTLSYSIKNETVWQSSNVFSNLGIGQYTIRVKNDTGCEVEYTSNPVILDMSTCVEICDDGIDNDGDGLIDCDDPDCDDVGTGTGINNN